VCSLQSFYKGEKTIRLERFSKVKNQYDIKDQELLELWESMLTGRVAPVSKWMKDRYKNLGLSHLFTPSGFHLSAILSPLFKIFQNTKFHFITLCLITFGLFFIPGQGALKRMSLIKLNQKIYGSKLGFVIALVLDTLFGTFQSGALSFTYSFLFLGIIYSGLEGIGLIFWFFLAQIILAYFQGTDISPLLLVLSPVLNLGFGVAMPLLFILAIYKKDQEKLWSQYQKDIMRIRQDKYEKQLLKTFDFTAWIESKLTNIPLREILSRTDWYISAKQ
jgi:hypothetical protein